METRCTTKHIHVKKTFKYEDSKQKYIKIEHENFKWYCHFYNNNNTECPHKNECVFLHEESEQCRYQNLCERQFCMYKHEENVDTEDDHENEISDKKNETFVNQSQIRNVEDSPSDNGEVLTSVIDSNTKTIEPNKNKHSCICKGCDWTFATEKKMKKHYYHVHSGISNRCFV